MKKRINETLKILLVLLFCGTVGNLNVLATSGGSVSNEAVVGFYQEDDKPTPEPTPEPKPTPEPEPTPEPTPEPKPTPEPTPTPKPSIKLPQTGSSQSVSAAVSGGIIIVSALGVLLIRKRKESKNDYK